MKTSIKDISLLLKLRLSSLVVFSALMGYLMVDHQNIVWLNLFWLMIAGTLVTGASNALNQIFEKNPDSMMERTKDRPLPADRMNDQFALFVAIVSGIAGILLFLKFFGPLSAFISLLALVLYAFVYTPLKKITPFAVFVGAIPGALPPLIGWAAASDTLSYQAWILFSIQFFWQFPHFWAIAWVQHDDYKKAGFHLLPSPGGRDKASAMQTVVYSFSLIPLSFLPFSFQMSGLIAVSIMLIAALILCYQSVQLLKTCEISSARQLMFGSFFYLPVVQLVMVLDKI
ncbi:MAG TPA: heme o synthase [Bacteroidia bacterium]|nr:heme o synthase [Bacteroidia bacterium]